MGDSMCCALFCALLGRTLEVNNFLKKISLDFSPAPHKLFWVQHQARETSHGTERAQQPMRNCLLTCDAALSMIPTASVHTGLAKSPPAFEPSTGSVSLNFASLMRI